MKIKQQILTPYDKYLRLKASFGFKFRGYDLKYIMAHDFCFYAYGRADIFNKKTAGCLITTVDVLDEYKEALALPVDLFTSGYYGEDHWALFLDVMKNSSNHRFIKHVYRKKKRICIRNIISSAFQCFILWHPNGVSLSLLERLYYACKCVYYKNFINELEAQAAFVQCKKYVSYISATTPESILCQFFKKYKVPTYCIQHGVIRAPEDYPFSIPLDFINAENFQADYILGWGEYTKTALVKCGFTAKVFLLAGHPRYGETDIRLTPSQIMTERCIVCLARDAYKKENFELLFIASQIQREGIKIYIKLHPRSSLKTYQKFLEQYHLEMIDIQTSLAKSISDVNPDFVVVYNSTVYYEYYLYGIPAFRYGLNENDIPLGLEEDRFFTCAELLQKIDLVKNMDRDVYLKKIRDSIGKVIEYGTDNYKEIFSNA